MHLASRTPGSEPYRAPSGPWWLAARLEQLPTGLDWLSGEEKSHLARFSVEKRRNDWLLGRWTAKSALLAAPLSLVAGADPADLTVRQAPDGAPQALLSGHLLPLTLSISHRRGWGICALVNREMLLGCDLELVEARSRAFLQDYFTLEEREALADPGTDRDRCATLGWAAKESALKALRTGLRADTRRIRVAMPPRPDATGAWTPLKLQDLQSETPFGGWFRILQDLVLVVVTSPESASPRALVEGQ
jgi:4'-phosphopantetheinyl transferase